MTVRRLTISQQIHNDHMHIDSSKMFISRRAPLQYRFRCRLCHITGGWDTWRVASKAFIEHQKGFLK